jgi:uncharacterized protein
VNASPRSSAKAGSPFRPSVLKVWSDIGVTLLCCEAGCWRIPDDLKVGRRPALDKRHLLWERITFSTARPSNRPERRAQWRKRALVLPRVHAWERTGPGAIAANDHQLEDSDEQDELRRSLRMPHENRERMAKFYQTAFGWHTRMLGEDMGNYVLATTTEMDESGPKKPGAINGGILPKRPDWPAQHPTVVIAVDDVQASMKKVAEAGGRVLGEPMEIPGVGQYVAFFDSEGNRSACFSPTRATLACAETQVRRRGRRWFRRSRPVYGSTSKPTRRPFLCLRLPERADRSDQPLRQGGLEVHGYPEVSVMRVEFEFEGHRFTAAE